jgi:hypothetical protein
MDHFEVEDFVENEDGSATITLTMDYDTLLLFARKGILATLIDTANKIVDEQKIENEM